jgi:Kef-type K+ transport system membrane component KefB
MIVAVRPVMTWIALHCTTNEPVKEMYICVTLAGVLVAGFCTDAIGIHLIFGAFLLGLVIRRPDRLQGFS